MLLEALLVLTTALPRLEAGMVEARRRAAAIELPTLAPRAAPASLPYFIATARAVSNWRDEAGSALMPTSLALVAKYAASEPAFVARCVKLNNYWCIKQARWSGELGGDAEGHTGFASAADGADAAALLLRRYYREFGRRNALAIVRRWAPSECGFTGTAAAAKPQLGRAPARPQVSLVLAPRGIGNTLRARFLARHGRGGVARSAAARAVPKPAQGGLRVQPWSARARLAGHPGRAGRIAATPLPTLKPVADIATGIGGSSAVGQGPRMPPTGAQALLVARRNSAEAGPLMPPTGRAALLPAYRPGTSYPAALLAPDRLAAEAAALPSIAGGLLDLSVPAPVCTGDETRIRNYAGRIATSVGLSPEDDLGLFAADGTPTARLAPVMLAMSQVELGALHATPALVAAAISRLSLRPMAATASGGASPSALAR